MVSIVGGGGGDGGCLCDNLLPYTYAKKRLIPATFFLFSVGTHQQGTSIHVSIHLPFSKRKTKLENMSMSSHCSSSTMNLSMMKIWKYSE